MIKGPSPVERVLRPLDAIRRQCLAACLPWIRPLILSREKRITVSALLLMTVALTFAMSFPLWVLALGPIIWGVPHVIGDIRYLVLRPGHHRRIALVVGAGIPLALAGFLNYHAWLYRVCRSAFAIGLIGAIIALLVSRTSWRKRVVGTLVLGACSVTAYQYGYYADLLFAHAHNLIAVGLWWVWSRRNDNIHWLPLAFFGLACMGLLVGIADPILQATGGLSWAPHKGELNYYLSTLAPPFSPHWGIRIVLLFTFAQSVHYMVWVRLIPEEDRPQATPRTFAASYRALKADFGAIPLLLAALFALAIVAWAISDLMAARIGYLRLAIFHGHLEVIAATLLWAEADSSPSHTNA